MASPSRHRGDLTYDICKKYVDEIVTVDESEIASAILILLERGKTLPKGPVPYRSQLS